MPELHFVPEMGYKHPEYLASENKDILVIWLYANDPNNPEPRKKLTFKHYAAIKKAELLHVGPITYANLKIDSQEFEERAIQINKEIKCLNHYHNEIINCGWKVNNDRQRNGTVLQHVKQHFPDFTLSDLDERYKLSEFLELLERGVMYEQQYLESLSLAFEKIADFIKQEFGFELLNNL